MRLNEYINQLSADSREPFAAAVGTTLGYLRKAMSTGQPLGAEICTQIEIHSGALVTRQELRPDDWKRIWPELTEKVAA